MSVGNHETSAAYQGEENLVINTCYTAHPLSVLAVNPPKCDVLMLA